MLSSTSVLVCVMVACVVVQFYRRTVTQRNTMSNGLTGVFNLIHHFPALTSISRDPSPPPCPQGVRTLWGPGQIFHSICLTFVMIYFVKSRSEAEKPTVKSFSVRKVVAGNYKIKLKIKSKHFRFTHFFMHQPKIVVLFHNSGQQKSVQHTNTAATEPARNCPTNNGYPTTFQM